MGRRSGRSGGATGSLARSGIATPPAWAPARENSHKLAQTVRTAFAEQSPSHPPAAYFELASAALRGGAELKQMAIESLVGVLEQRLHAEMRELWLKLGFAVAGVVLLVYLSLSFYFSFAGAVRQLHRGVDKVLGGDLSARIEIEGRDELAEIVAMVERMNERLSTLVAEIRSSAARVSMSGEVVASGSQALAGRTEQQAASLRQAVVTVQHLSSAVAANAAEASELDRLTAALRSEAEVGGRDPHTDRKFERAGRHLGAAHAPCRRCAGQARRRRAQGLLVAAVDREGKRVHEVPGIDGDRFVRDAWPTAPSNGGRGGWIEYDIINPETGKVQPKASFMLQLDDRHVVGCGIYRVTAAATA